MGIVLSGIELAKIAKKIEKYEQEIAQLKRENEGLVIDRECAISNITTEFLKEEQRLRKALEQIMEVEALIMEGWETRAYKIAQEALGGEAHE